MVELQKTFSFDEHILPHLLREREKYSGRLAEEGYGNYNSFIQDCFETQQNSRQSPNSGPTTLDCKQKVFNWVAFFPLLNTDFSHCFIDAEAVKKKLQVRIVGQERDHAIILSWNDSGPSGTVSTGCTPPSLSPPPLPYPPGQGGENR